jgi:hypothetical protein
MKLSRRTRLRLVLYLVLGYLLWAILVFFWQDKLIFPADLAPKPSPPPSDAVRLTLETDQGMVEAWYFPCPEAVQGKARPLVVYFHGNGEVISEQEWMVEGYRELGVSALLPEYRGYGNSAGAPSQKRIVSDAAAFLDQVVARPEVDPARVVLHGRSLGGGVAAQVALRRPPAALVLESSFTSLSGMALRYGLPPFLARHPFRTDKALGEISAPVLIFHGSEDRIIPVSHGRRLAEIVGARGRYLEYECGHNDFPGIGNRKVYWGEIEKFLKESDVLE